MTIRLLQAWNGYPAQAQIDVDRGTEAALISTGVATARLANDSRWIPNSPYSTTPATILSLTGDAVSNQRLIQDALTGGGTVSVLQPGAYPVVSDSFTFNSNTTEFIYAKGVSFTINGRPQNLRTLKPEPPASIAPTAQIRWGSYGDSICNISSLANQDLRTYTTGNIALTHIRCGPWLGNKSNGYLRPVFNGGVSGETTTQMVARETAGASATRRAILDAQTVGVEFLIYSAGINDIQGLAAGATQAQIDTVVSTAFTNLTFLFNKARSCGITSIFCSLMPYTFGTAAENVTRTAAIRQFNTLFRNYFAANPEAGYFFNVYDLLGDQNGNWLGGMTDDGLHPNHNGCNVYCEALANFILDLKGVGRTQFGLPKTPTSSINMLDNADLSLSASGVATRFTITGTIAGTGTVSGQQIVRINGTNFQEWTYTPATFDGNGNAACGVDIVIPIFGGAPYVAVALNDLIAAEADIYVDNGSGGAPQVYQYMFRFRIFGGVGLFMDAPGFNPTVTPKTPYGGPLNVHACTIPTTAGEASATMTNCTVTAYFFSTNTTPYRVRIGNVRVVRVPAGY
jgi:lysophospholipase L1-like esterase